MKLHNCRKAILSLSLLMFLGVCPFDWLMLITNYFFSQSDAVLEQTVPENKSSVDVPAPPGAPPINVESGGQCPMCPSGKPRPRPIPPGL